MAKWKDAQSTTYGIGLMKPGVRLMFNRGCMCGMTGTVTEAHDRSDGRDGAELTVNLDGLDGELVRFNAEHEREECYQTFCVLPSSSEVK